MNLLSEVCNKKKERKLESHRPHSIHLNKTNGAYLHRQMPFYNYRYCHDYKAIQWLQSNTVLQLPVIVMATKHNSE